MNNRRFKYCGIGLRFDHIDQILKEKPEIPWLEIITDNYLHADTIQQDYLCEINALYPISFHGVGLSLGSVDPLDKQYLENLKVLAEKIKPIRVSDHLCWTSVHGVHSHDLLPLPYTKQTVTHVADRIKQVQDYLGRELVIENVSSYLQYTHSSLPEWDFINAVTEQADCGILLDVNNVYVNAVNHRFEAEEYLDAVNMDRVREIHLAGFEDRGTHLLDTHSAPVAPQVWELFKRVCHQKEPIPVLIEWDNQIPPLEQLLSEAMKAESINQQIASLQKNGNAL